MKANGLLSLLLISSLLFAAISARATGDKWDKERNRTNQSWKRFIKDSEQSWKQRYQTDKSSMGKTRVRSYDLTNTTNSPDNRKKPDLQTLKIGTAGATEERILKTTPRVDRPHLKSVTGLIIDARGVVESPIFFFQVKGKVGVYLRNPDLFGLAHRKWKGLSGWASSIREAKACPRIGSHPITVGADRISSSSPTYIWIKEIGIDQELRKRITELIFEGAVVVLF